MIQVNGKYNQAIIYTDVVDAASIAQVHVDVQAFDDYIHDMRIAQHFASTNRHAIVDVIVKNMGFHVADSFTTILDVLPRWEHCGILLHRAC